MKRRWTIGLGWKENKEQEEDLEKSTKNRI